MGITKVHTQLWYCMKVFCAFTALVTVTNTIRTILIVTFYHIIVRKYSYLKLKGFLYTPKATRQAFNIGLGTTVIGAQHLFLVLWVNQNTTAFGTTYLFLTSFLTLSQYYRLQSHRHPSAQNHQSHHHLL